ncbi:hypothetical protein SLEP1_g31438 [Rubroshorea leprosula]|uniref:Uncharacterized protein n=1 Tax=Rubroshorea leprosula TaxID=152421 RepID=A0AAV5KB83_9ROSI|nr:hypothetical protein SLEP1_g31438 [Rubroshorea leprosula]
MFTPQASCLVYTQYTRHVNAIDWQQLVIIIDILTVNTISTCGAFPTSSLSYFLNNYIFIFCTTGESEHSSCRLGDQPMSLQKSLHLFQTQVQWLQLHGTEQQPLV